MCAALKSSHKSLSMMPISPFHEDDIVFLDEFYTDIVIKNHAESGNCGNKEKEQYPYKQIFADSRTERIILTGLSGSGKSTFCKKIVSIWCGKECVTKDKSVIEPGQMIQCKPECSADEDALSQFSLVFYIYLPQMLTEASLIDILHKQCKRSESGQSSKSDNLSQILEEQPNKILIILDGIDEMGDDSPPFLTELLGRKLYPNVIVLIAMRPWKISKLKLKKGINYDLLVEINGFSENDALKFIRKVIDHNIKCKTMKGPHPSPEEEKKMSLYGNVPLLLLFLVQIRCNDGYLPDKHKDLYQKILECLVKRCLSKTGNKYIPALTDQDDMNRKKDVFWELYVESACKAAYHFLLQQVSAIPEEALISKLGKDAHLKLNALLDCGILSKLDAYSPLEQKYVSITFLHFSIQEHLASKYLVKNEEAFQKFLESVETLDDVFRYENLFIFICGLNENIGHSAFIKICQVCDNDPLVIQFRRGRDYDGHIKASLANLNGLYKECLKEMNSQGIIEIPDIVSLEDEWYVTEMSRLRSSTTKSLYLCCVTLHRDDALDLSSMINLTFLALCKIAMSEECSRSLCRSINGCIHMRTMKMEKMTLYDYVFELSNLPNLTSLILDNVTMSRDCSRSLCSSINSCTDLDNLLLVSIRLHDGILDLSRLANLTSLTLCDVSMSEECSRTLSISISGCILMERLKLEKMTLCVLDLSNLTHLTSLILDNVTLYGDCRPLCSSINSCTDLDNLQLEGMDLHNGILDLRRLTKLTSLALRNMTISEECDRSLRSSISNCTFLERKLELITIQNSCIPEKSDGCEIVEIL